MRVEGEGKAEGRRRERAREGRRCNYSNPTGIITAHSTFNVRYIALTQTSICLMLIIDEIFYLEYSILH